jgi:hypothetical protein
MTDTKHELPEIDWTKPVESSGDGKIWFDTFAVMRGNNLGQPFCSVDGLAWVINDNGYPVAVKVRNIRNKPEPLECWINVYSWGPAVRVYKSEDEADRGAFDGRIRCVRMREVLEND